MTNFENISGSRMERVYDRVYEHYKESTEHFSAHSIVGCFLQGSQNYNLDTKDSDVDTKLIVVPTFKDICVCKKPISHTHVRENNEHIDFKDIRLYMETFRKQNINFVEILFTSFCYVNQMYQKDWSVLVKNREGIARMNEVRAVKAMWGVALEKYHAMEHRYPSKADIIDNYGYDGKQVSHLLRVEDFMRRYINGEQYKDCLIPSPGIKQKLLDYKALNVYSVEEARVEAEESLNRIKTMVDNFVFSKEEKENEYYKDMLTEVSYNIMRLSAIRELEGESV